MLTDHRDRQAGNLTAVSGAEHHDTKQILKRSVERAPTANREKIVMIRRWKMTVAAAAMLVLTTAGMAATPAVRLRAGNVEYRDADGHVKPITSGGGYREAVLSADGRRIAFIHIDTPPPYESMPNTTSLWVADLVTGKMRRLLSSRADKNPERSLASFQHPRFSLGGGFVYIDAEAWATSNAVHQIRVATSAERFVIDGSTLGIIRTGPYRGYLLVGRHKYHPAPEGGSYDPVSVVRPDGTEVLMVPGSDEDDGAQSVPAWLERNGWTAF